MKPSNYLKTLEAVEDLVEGFATVVEVNLARANLASSRADRHWAERQRAQDFTCVPLLTFAWPSSKWKTSRA